MRIQAFLILVALGGCTGLSGMVSSHDSLIYVSELRSALASMSAGTVFEVSGFDGGTFYTDCGLYLKDYGSEYSYGKTCRVYGQTDMKKYLYVFEFGSETSLGEFAEFLSSITKFSPELSSSYVTDYPVIVFDNNLRHSYSFMCGERIVIMLSQDLSNPDQNENELSALAYDILSYCDKHTIV